MFHNIRSKYVEIHRLLSACQIEMTGTRNIVEELRYAKSEEEVANTRIACEIADKALEELVPYIKPGVTEKRAVRKAGI